MNLSALTNITPYSVNNSLINDSTQIGTNLITNANVQTQGYLGLGIMIIVFIFLLLVLMSQSEIFRFDFISSLIFSAGISTLIGSVMIVSNLISNYFHVLWFAIILIIGLIAKYYQTKGG